VLVGDAERVALDPVARAELGREVGRAQGRSARSSRLAPRPGGDGM